MVLNNSAFTLEDLYHPELAYIISIVQYICFILNTLVFAFTSFVVLKKSPKEMNTYKYIMFAQLLWTYFCDVGITIWQPIFLLPYAFIYSEGIWKVGVASVWISVGIGIIIVASLVHSLVYGLVYRIVQIFWNTKICWYFENKKNVFISFTISYLIIVIYASIPPLIFVFNGGLWHMEEMRQIAAQENPVIGRIIVLEPTIGGCNDSPYCNDALISAAILYPIAVCLACILVLSLYMLFFKKIRGLKSQVQPKTYQIHITLALVLFLQMCLISLSLFVPAIVIYASFYIGIHSASYYCSIVFLLCNFHGLSESFMILYVVKPYRHYVQMYLSRLLGIFRKSRIETVLCKPPINHSRVHAMA